MKRANILLVLICILLAANSVMAEVKKEVQVELGGQWYPATVAEEKENFGVKSYRVVYTASGGQEWVAPNRVLLDPKAAKPTVGQTGGLPASALAGDAVSIEYNGGWYPGKLNEITALAGVPVYKVTYTQSGLTEYVASNRIKASTYTP